MYRLHYWAKRGRGEQIRLLLNELDQPYQDVHVAGESFAELRARRPRVLWFGTVPMLEDGDLHLCQAPVILSYLARKHGVAPARLEDAARADAIAWGAEDLRIEYFNVWRDDTARRQADLVRGHWNERYLPGFDDLLAQSGSGFFVGDALSHADVAVWDILDSMITWVAGATLEGYPRLAGFYAAIKARPRIAAYLASERRPTG
ncbi:MAG TPA: glutathione S-transferase [Kofleriaceae bacterium]|nr:glutathione S-transferase [Kofleriaceae bacterium]